MRRVLVGLLVPKERELVLPSTAFGMLELLDVDTFVSLAVDVVF